MTEFRTSTHLFDHLDRQFAWRLREIIVLTSAVEEAEGRSVNVHVRSAVTLLYAHWEGFVRDTANAYINYLSHRADSNELLIPALVALSLKTKFPNATSSRRSRVVVPMFDFLLGNLSSPVALPRSDGVSAESNLNSHTFENIAGWIGIDTANYETRYPIIDDVLLPSRNAVAHGEHTVMAKERYLSLKDEVIFLMRSFKDDVSNAVAIKAYLRAAPTIGGVNAIPVAASTPIPES